MKPIRIIKNRSDIGAGTRGSDMGIDAIEIAAINKSNDYFMKYDYMDLDTHNETVYSKVKAPFAKRISFVLEQCQRLSSAVSNVLGAGEFPLVMSGDHSSALGTISGIKAQYPDKKLAVIWIDAHADLHSPYTTPSGNVHGMPLAAALGFDNQEEAINSVSDNTRKIWEDLKSLGIDGAKLSPDSLVFFGVRDTEEPEENLMARHNIRNYSVSEFRFRGAELCLQECKDYLNDADMIYISFDVDSLDCDLVSKGTGTPVSKGFDPDEVKFIIKSLMDTSKLACLEITEVNPLLDTKGNVMAETAFEVLDDVTKHLESKV